MYPIVHCGMKLISHKNLQIIHKFDKRLFFFTLFVQFCYFVHYFVGEVNVSLSV